MKRIGAALKRKFGPLPMWAWLVIFAAGLYLYRRNRGASSAAPDPNAPDPNAAPLAPLDTTSPSGDPGAIGAGAVTPSDALPPLPPVDTGAGAVPPVDSGLGPPPDTPPAPTFPLGDRATTKGAFTATPFQVIGKDGSSSTTTKGGGKFGGGAKSKPQPKRPPRAKRPPKTRPRGKRRAPVYGGSRRPIRRKPPRVQPFRRARGAFVGASAKSNITYSAAVARVRAGGLSQSPVRARPTFGAGK